MQNKWADYLKSNYEDNYEQFEKTLKISENCCTPANTSAKLK